jgi:N-acetylglucosaminyldiphosphoundecaprenol N-acetyl-beta-D-mannosaminyltransferase
MSSTAVLPLPEVVPEAELLNAPFFTGQLEDAADQVVQRARAGRGGYACLCNAHVFVTATKDAHVGRALRDASMVFPDGWPVAWLLRRLGADAAERVAGADLMPLVFDRGQRVGLRHFLIGSTPEVLDKLAVRLQAHYPEALIAGRHSPPFGTRNKRERKALKRIRAAKPDVVWCALGAPKQELWIYRNSARLAPAFILGVGAAFDFLAETKQRAPAWMQRRGLEWFHRLGSEPRRLAGRYVKTNTRFVFLSLRTLSRRSWAGRATL